MDIPGEGVTVCHEGQQDGDTCRFPGGAKGECRTNEGDPAACLGLETCFSTTTTTSTTTQTTTKGTTTTGTTLCAEAGGEPCRLCHMSDLRSHVRPSDAQCHVGCTVSCRTCGVLKA